MLEPSGKSIVTCCPATYASAATPRVDAAYRCFVSSGDAAQGLARTQRPEVVCRDGASPAPREMYEASG